MTYESVFYRYLILMLPLPAARHISSSVFLDIGRNLVLSWTSDYDSRKNICGIPNRLTATNTTGLQNRCLGTILNCQRIRALGLGLKRKNNGQRLILVLHNMHAQCDNSESLNGNKNCVVKRIRTAIIFFIN